MPPAQLCLLWEWTWDAPLAELLQRLAPEEGLRAEVIGPDEIEASAARLAADPPRLLLDRASDCLPAAAALAAACKRRGSFVVNDPDRAAAASDKARMHLALMSAGVQVPWTLLLPPWGEETEPEMLEPLGSPFVIKPAHGGGGDGVVLGASTPLEIERARILSGADTLLVQERIEPVSLGGRPAWFRVLWCLDLALPCFWDPATSRYTALTIEEAASPWGRALREASAAIASVSAMSLFSTELALCGDGRLVAVDYVNDMCDLRPQSRCPDGVPDAVVEAIARRLLRAARGAGA